MGKEWAASLGAVWCGGSLRLNGWMNWDRRQRQQNKRRRGDGFGAWRRRVDLVYGNGDRHWHCWKQRSLGSDVVVSPPTWHDFRALGVVSQCRAVQRASGDSAHLLDGR